MKKVIELVLEAIFQSSLARHLNIISPTRPERQTARQIHTWIQWIERQCYELSFREGDVLAASEDRLGSITLDSV